MVDLVKKIEDKERLRQLQNKYQSKIYELCKKTKNLQNKFDNLALNNKASNYKLIIDFDNENNLISQLPFAQRPTFLL